LCAISIAMQAYKRPVKSLDLFSGEELSPYSDAIAGYRVCI